MNLRNLQNNNYMFKNSERRQGPKIVDRISVFSALKVKISHSINTDVQQIYLTASIKDYNLSPFSPPKTKTILFSLALKLLDSISSSESTLRGRRGQGRVAQG